MRKRWELFLAIYVDGVCSEPTLDLVKTFTVFIFKFRQRWSSSGRVGLGDAVAHMAQYVLAQVRVRLLCLRVRDVVLQPACRARSHGRRRACVLHARPRPGRSFVTVLQVAFAGCSAAALGTTLNIGHRDVIDSDVHGRYRTWVW